MGNTSGQSALLQTEGPREEDTSLQEKGASFRGAGWVEGIGLGLGGWCLRPSLPAPGHFHLAYSIYGFWNFPNEASSLFA